MKKFAPNKIFSALFALIALSAFLSFALGTGLLSGCVPTEQTPDTVQHVDSQTLALRVDSAAIYRCDTCAFAVAYLHQSTGKVKPCLTCDWVRIDKERKHDKGDVPELSNVPVNPLHEQDAKQHGTEHLVMPSGDSATSSPTVKKQSTDAVASRPAKPVNAPSGDGL